MPWHRSLLVACPIACQECPWFLALPVSLTYDLRVLPAVVAMCHCHGGRSFRRVVSSGGAFGFMQQCQCVRGSSRVSQPDALELYGAFSAVI